ncbi:hypothetical protein [Nocardiopsis sp. NRRL B-16309]|uniref:hypothetical protein n=1 Tax=Nocardiopsis sp. NRRL B-16309 TaxID=1519494 RepID=UPI0006ADEFDF|nr:hypothetical protein [Nocardiopsis sp. NRRL B-16309]KOX22067.1 hypothetical protein ADL05_03245 [Nocardiopsis sp. NRRL B-16309]
MSPAPFHQPGRPEDLPPPGMLWAHGRIELGAYRLLEARPEETFTYDPVGTTYTRDGFTLGPHGMHFDNSAGCWWRLTWVEGGRAVLTGWEPLGQDTIDEELDLLAGGPDWLPWEWLDTLIARYRHEQMGVSFLYWWDGAWGRTDYPDGIDDDGLVTVEGFGTPEELVDHSPVVVPDDEHHLAVADELMRDVAEGGGERAWELFRDLFGADRVDVAAARELLGADWFTWRGAMPAGTPSAAPRRRRVLSMRAWEMLVARAMRSASEAERPAPQETEELRALREALGSLAAERGGELTFTVACERGAMSFPALVDASGEAVEVPWEDSMLPWRLRRAEAHPEHGAWYFLRARATAAGVVVERAYDHWPEWGRRSGRFPNGMAPPRLPDLQEEMAARSPRWWPEWVHLLDDEVPFDPPTDV